LRCPELFCGFDLSYWVGLLHDYFSKHGQEKLLMRVYPRDLIDQPPLKTFDTIL